MVNKLYEKIKNYIKENIIFLLSLIAIILLFTIELPFVIYTPGGKVDLSKRVEIENGYKTKGELGLTYVSMVKSSTPFVLLSFVMPNWDLEKVDKVTYGDMSMDETIAIDKIYMQEGNNNAIISAYNLAGKEVKYKSKKVMVAYISKKCKAKLKIGDELIEIDGKKINGLDDIQNVTYEKKVGDEVTLKIKRNDKVDEIKATLINFKGEPKIGITTVDLYDLETNPKVTIKNEKRESGSSGGLMTALAIYNGLVKEDITHGDIIVGTGTIDKDGNVGEIDGIKYKLIGAEKKKAKVFLCPKNNYKEALKVKKKHKLKIKIKKVETLKEAVEYLESRD